MKRIALVLAILSVFAFACASNMTPKSAPLGGSDAVAGKFSPTIYRLVSDPDMLLDLEIGRQVRPYHVKGQVVNGKVIWASQIEGKGKLCPEGKEWVALNHGTIHPATETPAGPHILGCRASNGLFQPASTEVYQ